MSPPFLRYMPCSPFVRRMHSTMLQILLWRLSSKKLHRRLKLLAAVLTWWAVCRIFSPPKTIAWNSQPSHTPFLPFWRGTSRTFVV